MSYKQALHSVNKGTSYLEEKAFIERAKQQKFQPNNKVLTADNVIAELDQVITDDSFILIDGPSCSGKSTLGKALQERFNATIIDIDKIAWDYFEGIIAKYPIAKNPLKYNKCIREFEQITDEYLEDNLERLVRKAKKRRKPVILIGHYVSSITRAIVFNILAKNFDTRISLFCYESEKKRFKAAIKKRNEIDFKDSEESSTHEIDLNTLKQYNEVTAIMNKSSEVLGIGVDVSMILDFSCIEAIK